VSLSRNVDKNMPKNAYFLEKSCKIAGVFIHWRLRLQPSVLLFPLTDIVLMSAFLALNVFNYYEK